MSDNIHLIWLGIAAVVVTAVLTVGTLGAADLLPQRRSKRKEVSSPGAGSASRRV